MAAVDRLSTRCHPARLPRGARAGRIRHELCRPPYVPAGETRDRQRVVAARRGRGDRRRAVDHLVELPADRSGCLPGVRLGGARDARRNRATVRAQRSAGGRRDHRGRSRPDSALRPRRRAAHRDPRRRRRRPARARDGARAPCAGDGLHGRRACSSGARGDRPQPPRNVLADHQRQPVPAWVHAGDARSPRDRRAGRRHDPVSRRRRMVPGQPAAERDERALRVRLAGCGHRRAARRGGLVVRPSVRRRARARPVPVLRHPVALVRTRRGPHRGAPASAVGRADPRDPRDRVLGDTAARVHEAERRHARLRAEQLAGRDDAGDDRRAGLPRSCGRRRDAPLHRRCRAPAADPPRARPVRAPPGRVARRDRLRVQAAVCGQRNIRPCR